MTLYYKWWKNDKNHKFLATVAASPQGLFFSEKERPFFLKWHFIINGGKTTKTTSFRARAQGPGPGPRARARDDGDGGGDGGDGGDGGTPSTHPSPSTNTHRDEISRSDKSSLRCFCFSVPRDPFKWIPGVRGIQKPKFSARIVDYLSVLWPRIMFSDFSQIPPCFLSILAMLAPLNPGPRQ